MPATCAATPSPCVALFDLDGTLTWRDTLLPYLAGYWIRHPARWWYAWRLPFAVVRFLFLDRDRGELKSRVIRAVMGGEPRAKLDAWTASFVTGLEQRHIFRPAALAVLEAHRAAGDHLVLLSASPDLYVPRIGRLLGFEHTVCTELTWLETEGGVAHLEGRLLTPNRRGEEKSACLVRLRAQYPGLTVVAYGNSTSDLPLLRRADRALLVNGNAAARRNAAHSGIPVGDWT